MSAPSTFAERDQAWRLQQVLRRYAVRMHYDATFAARRGERSFDVTLYAVWADGEQVTEPASHAETRRAAEQLTIDAIMAIFDGGAR